VECAWTDGNDGIGFAGMGNGGGNVDFGESEIAVFGDGSDAIGVKRVIERTDADGWVHLGKRRLGSNDGRKHDSLGKGFRSTSTGLKRRIHVASKAR
jgi:hypothetical protein